MIGCASDLSPAGSAALELISVGVKEGRENMTHLVSGLWKLLAVAVVVVAFAGAPALAQTGTAAPAEVPEGEEFISWDTLIVGCAAGGFSAGVAAVLPLLTSYAEGGPTTVTSGLLGAWAGLGCMVGVWAGIIAIGTAMLLDSGGGSTTTEVAVAG